MATLGFFGRLAEAGWSAPRAIDLPEAVGTIAALRQWLAATQPTLALELARPGVRAVIDNVIVGDDAAIAATSDIAFIPPVSGG